MALNCRCRARLYRMGQRIENIDIVRDQHAITDFDSARRPDTATLTDETPFADGYLSAMRKYQQFAVDETVPANSNMPAVPAYITDPGVSLQTRSGLENAGRAPAETPQPVIEIHASILIQATPRAPAAKSSPKSLPS